MTLTLEKTLPHRSFFLFPFSFLIGFVAAAVASQAAPYWFHLKVPASYDRHLPSGRELIGRSFVLLPEVPEERVPRYDYHVLLTFGEKSVEELRPFGHETHAITYESYGFTFDRAVGNWVFALSHDGDEHQFLVARPRDEQGLYSSYGYIREVNGEEAQRFRSHVRTTEEAEKKRRAADHAAAKGRPLSSIEVYDFAGSRSGVDLIWKIYYGRFAELKDPRFQGDRPDLVASQAMVVHASISNLFRTYHKLYSVLYGDGIKEPTFLTREDLVTFDGWGYEKSRIEGQTFRIRSRFETAYNRSTPNAGVALGILFKSFDSVDKTLNFGKMLDVLFVGTACEEFLRRYKTTSPATVAHFEENLERAILGEPPVVIELPKDRSAVRQAPYRLPWEAAPQGSAARETIADYAISWVRPMEWEKVSRGYGFAVYDAGFPNGVQVIVSYKAEAIEDVLPYVNLWREREELAPVATVSDQPMETFELGGRRVLLISYPKSIQVLIHDGPRSWFVTMYGGPQVAERLGELRSFVRSFEWYGEPTIKEEPRPSSRGQGGFGSSTSRRGRRGAVREREEAASLRGSSLSADAEEFSQAEEGESEASRRSSAPPAPNPRVAPLVAAESPAPEPSAGASATAIPGEVFDHCPEIPRTLLASILQSSRQIEPTGRAREGCHLEVAWSPPLSGVLARLRASITAAGQNIAEDRDLPALGGRHVGRHFLRFEGEDCEGSLVLDEYQQPIEIVGDLELAPL